MGCMQEADVKFLAVPHTIKTIRSQIMEKA